MFKEFFVFSFEKGIQFLACRCTPWADMLWCPSMTLIFDLKVNKDFFFMVELLCLLVSIFLFFLGTCIIKRVEQWHSWPLYDLELSQGINFQLCTPFQVSPNLLETHAIWSQFVGKFLWSFVFSLWSLNFLPNLTHARHENLTALVVWRY